MKTDFNKECITFSQINMIFNARLFWRRLTTWTRTYIVSRYTGIGTPEDAFSRLYIENLDFGDLLQLVFGRVNANRYSQMLNEYTSRIRELITAQLQGNSEAMDLAVAGLYRNTEERAAFLSSINPYFKEAEWRELLATYLRYTIEEANAFASGDYQRDIVLFDRLAELGDKIGYLFIEDLYAYITSDCRCPSNGSPEQCVTYEQMNAFFGIRMLWFEIIVWSRAYMLSLIVDIGNEQENLERLKLVSDNLGDMIGGVFGEEAAAESEGLINIFIDLIHGLITNQQAGNIEEVDRYTQLLYQDADFLAAFLSGLNPFWDESRWRTILYDIVRNLIVESTTLLAGDYARNLDVFSTLLDQAEGTSDYFAQGLYQYLVHTSLE